MKTIQKYIIGVLAGILFLSTMSYGQNAPTFTSTPITVATQGLPYSYTATAEDLDEDPLVFTAMVLPSWVSFDEITHELSGIPGNADVGMNDVTLRINDGTADVDQFFTITVANVNDDPVFTTTAITDATEDSPYTYTVVAIDIDGDDLTYSAPVIPTWLSFNTGTQELSGIPTNDDVGDHSVTLSVFDGTETVNQDFTITVASRIDMISGVVYDENWNPLTGVTVTLVEAGLSTQTLGNGSYVLMGIGDPYCDQMLTVLASLTGYVTSTVNYYESCEGNNQTINIWMNTGSSPLLVTNTDDSGSGSLRNAIMDANANTGKDYIQFDIPGAGVHTILPETALPAITDPLVINGLTQPGASQNTSPAGTGFNTVLLIEIEGNSAGDLVNGLTINSDGCEISGLIINRFENQGVVVYGDNNSIYECFIGTNASGGINRPNRNHGISLSNGASGNVIGPGNLISGNFYGVYITGTSTSGNSVVGNFLGTTATGLDTITNRNTDIRINDSPGNIIGGTEPGSRNVFSSLEILNPGAVNNTVSGNYIGVRASGDTPLIQANQLPGINIQGASNNTIGPGNVIGAQFRGIMIGPGFGEPEGTFGNKVIGNLIGTNADGSAAIQNTYGIEIYAGENNTIGGIAESDRNIISGSRTAGIILNDGATHNQILGNYFGTDISGKLAVPNMNQGITVLEGATENLIGTGINGRGNLFAFNDDQAIALRGDNNHVLGNVIYENAAGISIDSDNNTIGGMDIAERNIIWGNDILAILVASDGNHNLIEGNILGTDAEGREDKTDAEVGISILGSDNVIKSNLISGFSENALQIIRPSGDSPITQRNRIEENTIGLSLSGENFIPNGNGISIRSSTDNLILRNEISGNTGNGIVITDPSSLYNQISQNLIYNNGLLGIDLNNDGVTENDLTPDEIDIDIGPNNLQNFPLLVSVSFAEGKVTVTGSLSTESNESPSTYIIEFFASNVADNTGYGEGEFFLGEITLETDINGYETFETTLDTKGYGAQVITATATDPDGNTSEFSQTIGGVINQVYADMPFRFTLNSEGLSTIPTAAYQNAIRSAFQTWDDIPYAEIEMFDAGTSDEKYASATDGLNLVSFQDDRFPFATGVLAVTTKTLQISAGGTEAEVVDADIIFNPAYIHHPNTPFEVLTEGDSESNAFDIQSIATHEIGHVFGMIHSGVFSSTMFFMLNYGTAGRELGADDMAWAGYRYPDEGFQANHALISGRVTYGDLGNVEVPSSHPPVAGAMVLAVTTEILNQKMFHAYTDADGNYTVPIPMEGIASEEYWIYIQPLDGDVYGTPLKPANISPYIYSHTMFTDFPNEFYDDEESADDIWDQAESILVTAGGEVTGIDLITNRDMTPPTVIGTSLDEESVDVAVSPTIVIKFSEPVDIYSFDETTCYLDSSGTMLEGEYTLLADSTHIVLMKPLESLYYNTAYTLHIDGITDLKDNALVTAYTSSFTTLLPDEEAPEVYDVIPAHEASQVDVTKPIKVFFNEAMNKSSVESGLILMTIDSDIVAGEYNWDLANKEVSFVPDYSLEEGTDYIISLSTEVTDLADNALEDDATFTFSTVEVAIPEILYLGPADLSDGITVETPVVVKMSEPMDENTISSTSFYLTGTAGQVAGSYEYLDDNRTIIFRPDQALNFDQSYTITLTSDISDLSNPRQYLPHTTASFQTAPDVLVPHILYMEPSYGVVGAQTTIGGSGFDPAPLNNTVLFNGTPATVSKATLELLTVHVPNTAYSGPVTVSVNGVAADNSFEFDVVPANTDPSYNVLASASSGSRTRAVVIDPDAGYAYVTNWGDNTVTPIDISGDIPIPGTDIPVGVEPMDIDLNPGGSLAYVTNFLSNTVSVIGTKFGEATYHKVIKDIPVGYHPYGVAVSSDKKVYVANNESEYVSVIDVDPSSGGFDHVIANVKTGSKNRSVVATPDAALILVTGDNGVAIIDRDPGSPTFNDVVARASKGSRTRDVTYTPDAALALATTDDGVILIIDIFQPAGTEFGNVIASVKTGSKARNVTISADAMYVYITNPDDNTVSVYQLDYSIVPGYGASLNNPMGLIHLATIEVDDQPYAIVGHPNSEYILVTHDSETGGVTKIGVGEESVDVIHTLEELIASVENAKDTELIHRWLGNSLLYSLNVTLNRINRDQPLSAIFSLNRFIRKVRRNLRWHRIPTELGYAWLEAAYRIRGQLWKDFEEQQSLLKGSGETGSGSGTLDDLQKSDGRIMDLQRESSLQLENRPNPFSYHTQINFEIPNSGQADMPVMMRVFNINGQVIKTLVHMDMEPGRYSIVWNSDLDDGGLVPDGIYLLELRVSDQREAIRISVVK